MVNDFQSNNHETKESKESKVKQDFPSNAAKKSISEGLVLSKATRGTTSDAESELSSQVGKEDVQPTLIVTDPDLRAKMKEWKRTHDPANWTYEFGSPHKDHQVYKDLIEARRRYETSHSAATAESLPDAIDTTLKAKKGSEKAEDPPADQYFREKYGSTPYTTNAYPKEEEE